MKMSLMYFSDVLYFDQYAARHPRNDASEAFLSSARMWAMRSLRFFVRSE